MKPTEDQNPTEDRPLRRRWSPEEARAALAHTSLTAAEMREVAGHQSLDTLAAYRRTLRVTGATLARQDGMSARELADNVTGHRDTAALYVRRQSPFEQDVEDTDQR